MKVQQRSYNRENWWSLDIVDEEYSLVLVFFSDIYFEKKSIYDSLKKFYPKADIVMTSTSWEILGEEVLEKTISVTALNFDKTPIKAISKEVELKLKILKCFYWISKTIIGWWFKTCFSFCWMTTSRLYMTN